MMCCHFSATERHCATFQKPKGVLISPPSCGKQPAKPGLICQLSCRPGYVLSGAREVSCATSGKWSAKVQTAVCKGRCLHGAGEKPDSYIMAYECQIGLPLREFHHKSMVKWQVKKHVRTRKASGSKEWIYENPAGREWRKKQENEDGARARISREFPLGDGDLWRTSDACWTVLAQRNGPQALWSLHLATLLFTPQQEQPRLKKKVLKTRKSPEK